MKSTIGWSEMLQTTPNSTSRAPNVRSSFRSACSAAGWYPKRLFTLSPNFHQNYIRNLINASMDQTVLSVVMQLGAKSGAGSVSINNKRL
ncbi:MAG TPA: hypothetical protein VHQ22_09090 [Terriglobales bacterium]|nr:hypothetical protein [Terriglobales bacterium]